MATQIGEAQEAPRKSSFADLANRHRKGRMESPTDKSPGVRVQFVERSGQLGLQHTYDNHRSDLRLMIEATGGGASWVDFDRDGYPDVYVNQGGDPTSRQIQAEPNDVLYRNIDGTRFHDVTDAAGIVDRRYSQGVAAGDFDNDGFEDVLVTNVGPESLFRNMGDGTFENVASGVGVSDSYWSTSAAWADIDRDGDLDLYVCNYVDFDVLNPRICHNSKGRPSMCHPEQMQAVPDAFYLNQGDATFRECAREYGLFGQGNKALGVVVVDLNRDDWPDIYVANDTTPNFYFVNEGGQRFRESATSLGGAVNVDGHPQASMGIAYGDFDRNGYQDLYLTHFVKDWSTLYVNLGPLGLHDQTAQFGLSEPTYWKLGFGVAMQDFDCDGWHDIYVGNGHIDDHRDEGMEFEMNPQLFSFDGKKWREVSSASGEHFASKFLARGVALGDYDRDHLMDIAVINQGAQLSLLNNQSKSGHFCSLEFVGIQSNRRGIGVDVELEAGDIKLRQQLAGGAGYCTSSQPIMAFGLGTIEAPITLRVNWPSGARQELHDVLINQHHVIQEPQIVGAAP